MWVLDSFLWLSSWRVYRRVWRSLEPRKGTEAGTRAGEEQPSLGGGPDRAQDLMDVGERGEIREEAEQVPE